MGQAYPKSLQFAAPADASGTKPWQSGTNSTSGRIPKHVSRRLIGVSYSLIERRDVMTRLAAKILLLGGFAALAAAGVAGASPASSDVPALAVRFNADMLATDSGARALYRR